MFTIDASVHVNALNRAEAGSGESQAFLEFVSKRSVPVFSPTVLLVEVATTIARVFNDPAKGIAFAQVIHRLPGQVWVPLDEITALEAGRLGAIHGLRGADAVYAAIAHRHRSTLITLDRQQLERLSPILRTQQPIEALISLTDKSRD